MIYLDTHVVVWLYAGNIDSLSDTALHLIRENDLAISPTVILELGYLHEIGRVTIPGDEIVSDLSGRINLTTCQKNFQEIIAYALTMTWTRDAFDRIITGHASIDNDILLTKDHMILRHYPHARW